MVHHTTCGTMCLLCIDINMWSWSFMASPYRIVLSFQTVYLLNRSHSTFPGLSNIAFFLYWGMNTIRYLHSQRVCQTYFLLRSWFAPFHTAFLNRCKCISYFRNCRTLLVFPSELGDQFFNYLYTIII